MTQQQEAEQGCEDYWYKDMTCCLHPCSVRDCPEAICAIEFPGGINAYRKYKALEAILLNGADIAEAAQIMNVSLYTANYLYKKGSLISKCR